MKFLFNNKFEKDQLQNYNSGIFGTEIRYLLREISSLWSRWTISYFGFIYLIKQLKSTRSKFFTDVFLTKNLEEMKHI